VTLRFGIRFLSNLLGKKTHHKLSFFSKKEGDWAGLSNYSKYGKNENCRERILIE